MYVVYVFNLFSICAKFSFFIHLSRVLMKEKLVVRDVIRFQHKLGCCGRREHVSKYTF